MGIVNARRVRYPDLLGEVTRFLDALAERATAAGVAPDRIVLDPGHDFDKNSRQPLELTGVSTSSCGWAGRCWSPFEQGRRR